MELKNEVRSFSSSFRFFLLLAWLGSGFRYRSIGCNAPQHTEQQRTKKKQFREEEKKRTKRRRSKFEKKEERTKKKQFREEKNKKKKQI